MSPLISSPFLSRQSDARLVSLARAGNDRAFEALVKRYRSQLLAYARRMLGSDSRAEDALQQALLQAWIALRANAEPHEVKPWLFRIVHNASINVLRRRAHRTVELNEALDATTDAGTGEAHLAYKETLAHVAALPELQRRAIVLTAFGGSSHEEAAATLGLSDGAVRGLVHRARTTLRRAAAAVVPSPVLAWAAARMARRSAFPERIAELSAGVGSAGAAGLLVKGGAIAVTAGVLAAATQIGVPTPFDPGHRSPAASAVARAVRRAQPPARPRAHSFTVGVPAAVLEAGRHARGAPLGSAMEPDGERGGRGGARAGSGEDGERHGGGSGGGRSGDGAGRGGPTPVSEGGSRSGPSGSSGGSSGSSDGSSGSSGGSSSPGGSPSVTGETSDGAGGGMTSAIASPSGSDGGPDGSSGSGGGRDEVSGSDGESGSSSGGSGTAGGPGTSGG